MSYKKQILNRREKIAAGVIPPEIPDVSGFVTPTDYATASTGGVVKVGTTGGLQVSSGTLKGKHTDAEGYASAGDDFVITKATYEAIKPDVGGTEDYSTTEAVIGKWVDDKDLYQISIPFTIESGSNVTLPVSFGEGLTFDTLFIKSAFILKANGTIASPVSLGFAGGSLYEDASFCPYFNTANSSVVITGASTNHRGSGYVTICYTKKAAPTT